MEVISKMVFIISLTSKCKVLRLSKLILAIICVSFCSCKSSSNTASKDEIFYVVENSQMKRTKLSIEISFSGVCGDVSPYIEHVRENRYRLKVLGIRDGCKAIKYSDFDINMQKFCKKNDEIYLDLRGKESLVICSDSL